MNRFGKRLREGQDRRNRVVHDLWMADRHNPGNMGRLRITAEKKLNFAIQAVPLSELQSDLDFIVDIATEFHGIRKAIEAVLPTLPEIPQLELYPIIENP